MSPICTQRWEYVVYLCPLSAVCESVSVSVPFISIQRFLPRSWSNTRRWSNSGLMLAHSLRCWANISPVLGYYVVFDATLNVGQHHRWRANINPALVHSIVPVQPACRYRQHEVLTRAERMLASTGDAGPTFNRHLVSVVMYSPPAAWIARPRSPANTRRWTSAGLMLGKRCWRWARIGQHLVNVSCLLGVLGDLVTVDIKNWFHHSKYIISIVHRSHIITLITKAIAAGGETSPVFCLQKN